MADKTKSKSKPPEGSESSSRTRSETKLQQQQQQPDLTLGKAPIEKGERTGGQSRRFSVPVTQEERDEATMKELNEIEPVERIPSILRTMPIRRETSPDRPYALSRESVSPIGYPPEPLN